MENVVYKIIQTYTDTPKNIKEIDVDVYKVNKVLIDMPLIGKEQEPPIEQLNSINKYIIMGGDTLPHYSGDYTVIPDLKDITLDTKNKVMDSNVVVKEIPIYETRNASGGYTMIIGEGEEIYG